MAEIMGVSRILILERNKLTLRKVTRILTCTGIELIPMEDPAELPRAQKRKRETCQYSDE